MSPRLIVALDFNAKKEALDLAAQLDPARCALKIGSEMFTHYGPDLVSGLIAQGFKIFLDLKFHDIPNTVSKACKACADLGVWMINVHALGGVPMMTAAREALEPYGQKRPLLIAVTVLTSMDVGQLKTLGIETPLAEQAIHLAGLAKQSGLDGVVCSALEVQAIKAAWGKDCIAVTPGIRLPESEQNDQSRIMTPQAAIENGSDYLVVGRPITQAADPSAVVNKILQQITA